MQLMHTKKEPHYYQRNRKLTKEEFRHTLDVYTTNQDYYLETNQTELLEGLEHWFMHVIEPVPRLQDYNSHDIHIQACRSWLERELTKKMGYSYSCNRQARRHISLTKKDLEFCFHDVKTSLVIFRLEVRKRCKRAQANK